MDKTETKRAIQVMEVWVDDIWPFHIEFEIRDSPGRWCPIKRDESTWNWDKFNYRVRPISDLARQSEK